MTTGIERTVERMRRLDADDLGIGGDVAIQEHSSNRPDDPGLPDNHPLLETVRGLLGSFGGVLFSGPPGTSKSYFAAKIATALAADTGRVEYVQFHPSYQYEDFMEGFVPEEDGQGFELKSKYFVQLCEDAAKDPAASYVLVIDELSRGDPGRVFGEALTYVERSKRGLPFGLASGRELAVPPNLVILATMNPYDKGVDEVDAAFGRRFATIAMEPDRELLAARLEAVGLQEDLRPRVLGFFSRANARARSNPQGAVGHTYFFDVADEASLRRVWEYQLQFLLQKAYQLDQGTFEELERSFEQIFEPSSGEPEPSAAE